jgi:hypothetical protein
VETIPGDQHEISTRKESNTTHVDKSLTKAKTRRTRRPAKSRKTSHPPKDVLGADVYTVKAVVDRRVSAKGVEYLVEWEGYEGEKTWEPEQNFANNILVVEFEQRRTRLQQQEQRKQTQPKAFVPAPVYKPKQMSMSFICGVQSESTIAQTQRISSWQGENNTQARINKLQLM